MKDFIKWLGVNEKVAKVVVWLMIIMIMLILTNTMLESIGLPYYAITYKNIVKIDTNVLIKTVLSGVVAALNFYSVTLLVFHIKEAKPMFKYMLLYLVSNYLINAIFGYGVLQFFIIIFIVTFCYLYSNKNKKYILYSILAYIATVAIQGIWYLSKARFIDYTKISSITKSILSLDYFIIMLIIILVKEIYLKRRRERICGMDSDAFSGLENSKTKANSHRK